MSQARSISKTSSRSARWTAGAVSRAALTIFSILIVEMTVCGVSAAVPSLLLFAAAQALADPWPRVGLLAFGAAPAYVMFALCLMMVSAATTRLTGARTPPAAEMRIADMEWRLMQWVRYMAASHVVRLFAGHLFRGTPMWTVYLRLNGARFGRRVYVNSLFISDHNLLTFGNDVVIGGEVHLSGHTVENGAVKTGVVTLGDGVTIGLCSVVEIDVVAGAGAQVGALSFVPKHARLQPGETYVGIPVKPLHPPAILGTK
jgi:acetyltransferase-like isoleucine patch superfamily enzyme